MDGAFRGWCDAWLDPGFRTWNIEHLLAGGQAPLLAFQSADDPYGTDAQIDRLSRRWGGKVERATIGERGHAPHRDHPEATIEAVRRFLDGLGVLPARRG